MVTISAYGQDSISLISCYDSLANNYPLSGQVPVINESARLKIANINAKWLPQLNLGGQATYQSDVVEIGGGISIPNVNFPVAPKDQYSVTIDINQVIYDGGSIRRSRELENSKTNAGLQQVRVDMHQVKEQVNNVYFLILILQRNETLLRDVEDNLQQKLELVNSGVSNGILLPADRDNLKAELLKTRQELAEVINNRASVVEILNQLTGLKLSQKTQFILPSIALSDTAATRPEQVLFNFQKESLDASAELLKSQRLPRLSAFAKAGYGKPGLNILNNQWDTYYIIGANLSWNIWDWKQNNRQRQILALQKDLVDVNKATFDENLQISLNKSLTDIKNYESAVKMDEQIVQLRKSVTASAASRLKNGVISAADYLTELTAETQARVKYETDKINLIKAKVSYLTINGTY
jgi:outer membrane protein TolC